jgi:hypothetical protein
VNIYLYQTTPNGSLRNADLPSRDSSGQLSSASAGCAGSALYFHFYGDENKLEPQRLLGIVVRTLHSRAVLTRETISKLFGGHQQAIPMNTC